MSFSLSIAKLLQTVCYKSLNFREIGLYAQDKELKWIT